MTAAVVDVVASVDVVALGTRSTQRGRWSLAARVRGSLTTPQPRTSTPASTYARSSRSTGSTDGYVARRLPAIAAASRRAVLRSRRMGPGNGDHMLKSPQSPGGA